MVRPRLRLRSVHLLYADTFYMRKTKPQEIAQKALKILRLGSQQIYYTASLIYNDQIPTTSTNWTG